MRRGWATITGHKPCLHSWRWTLALVNSDLVTSSAGKDSIKVVNDTSVKVSGQSGAAVKREVGWMDILQMKRKYIRGLPA